MIEVLLAVAMLVLVLQWAARKGIEGALASLSLVGMAVGATGARRLKIQEVDGSPSGYPNALKLPNGTVTDNGDGTYTYTPATASAQIRTFLSRAVAGPGVTFMSVMREVAVNATETVVDDVCTAAMTVVGVDINITANAAAGDKVFNLRLNAGNTTLSATVAAGVTGPVSFTGTPVACAAADLIALRMEATGTGGVTIDTVVLWVTS